VLPTDTLHRREVTVDAGVVERVPVGGASAERMDSGDEDGSKDEECLHVIINYVTKR